MKRHRIFYKNGISIYATSKGGYEVWKRERIQGHPGNMHFRLGLYATTKEGKRIASI